MRAIIEKELKSYFCTVRGYIFIGVFLLISGYFFISYNVINGNSDTGVMMENTVVAFVLLIPVLTMGLFAGEKKAGTSSLYLSAPLAKWEIVLGKYLAAVIVFVCAVFINSLSAFMMIIFKGQTVGEVITIYMGFSLLGMAFIAVGMFISALTENQIVSAVVSLCACFSLYISDRLLEITSNPFILALALPSYYTNFLVGIFDIRAVIYFLSFSAVFVLLTILHLERIEVKAGKKSGTVFIAAVIVTSFLLITVSANQLSKKVQLTFDMSENKIFELTNETKRYLINMDEEVTIYYLVEDGAENPYINEVLRRYDRASSKIILKNVDLIKNPSFVSRYVLENETISKGSMIVESSKRFTVIEPDSAFAVQKDSNGNLSRTLGFSLEEKLTQALDYVLSERQTTAVWLTKHGEKGYEKPAGVLKKENISVEYSDDVSSITDKADLIVIFAPTVDISEKESEVIRNYLANGGKLFLALNPGYDLPLLRAISSDYGMVLENLVLNVDNISDLIRNNRFYLMAIPTKHKITEDITGTKNLLFPVASPVTICDINDCTVTKLAVSDSKTAARKFNFDTLGEKISTGVFTVCAISENLQNNSRVLLAGSSQFLVPQDGELGNILEASNYSNKEMFVKSVKYMIDYKDRLLISPKNIMSRSLNLEKGTQITLSVIFGGLIPLIVFAGAFLVFKRRRHG